jgi:hypothetical protein
MCKSFIQRNPLGPNTVPASKNPKIGDVFNDLQTGITKDVTTNNNNESNFIPK